MENHKVPERRQLQSAANKKAEVEFRKKLALQFEGKKTIFPGEPNYKEYQKIVKDRVKVYSKIFKDLRKNGVSLSHFLEIGGGVGQASMLLINKFNASGICSDISYETLKLAAKYKKLLKYKKLPTLMACDAYNLPFKDESIPFIFGFQTLHHFPDPKPVLAEVKRVLSPGGYFYFGEEPVAQAFNLNLWRRDLHLTWWEKALKATTLLHFISRIGKSEVEHGILEETFTIDTWEKALNQFDEVEVTIRIFPLGPTFKRVKTGKKGWLTPPFYLKIPLAILGGGIEALCHMEKMKSEVRSAKNILFFISCPNCKNRTYNLQHTTYNGLSCPNCKKKFKNKDGVLILFSQEDEKKLYG